MSQKTVKIVEAAIDAANRKDWDAVLQAAAPGFVLDMSRSQSFRGAGVYGLDQAVRFLVEFAESWESVGVEPHEFIEAGDLVVVPWTVHATGRDGIDVVSRPTYVWTIRDGAIERVSGLYASDSWAAAMRPPTNKPQLVHKAFAEHYAPPPH